MTRFVVSYTLFQFNHKGLKKLTCGKEEVKLVAGAGESIRMEFAPLYCCYTVFNN